MSPQTPALHRPLGPVDLEVLGARLREQHRIDDPTLGAAEPLEIEARSRLWPHGALWAQIELVEVTDSGPRRLEEYRFVPGPSTTGLPAFHGTGLPVAILFERSPNGLSSARVYSVTELAPGRAPPLPADTRLKLARPADALTRYLAAVQAGDLVAALASFEPQGYLQRSDGEQYRGAARLRDLLERCLERGGVALRYCSRFDEAERTVLELLGADGRPRLGVYQRGEAGRALSAVRLYC